MSEPKQPPPDTYDDEILDAGQEEVFSRREVELGRIEHGHGEGKKDDTPSD